MTCKHVSFQATEKDQLCNKELYHFNLAKVRLYHIVYTYTCVYLYVFSPFSKFDLLEVRNAYKNDCH